MKLHALKGGGSPLSFTRSTEHGLVIRAGNAFTVWVQQRRNCGKGNMILFDGTYRLQRQDDAPSKPIRQWACSWRLRIIDFSINQPDVQHLRPRVVVASQTGEGIFKTTCAESLGKRICRDFDLKIEDVLWIEHYPDEPALYVATFTPKSYYGLEIFYAITWRPILANELDAIKPFIPEAKHIECQ